MSTPTPAPAPMPNPWPFPSVNGQQTAQSKALQADKGQHKTTPINLADIEDALL